METLNFRAKKWKPKIDF